MSLYVKIKKVLGNFRLDIEFEAKDEILALLGSSGCGKSMTLKCVAGVETPDEGIIELDGRVLFDSRKKINLTPQQRKTGYLFQSYALFPNMTLEENIGIAINKPLQEKARLVSEKISNFRLEGLENHYPSQLSGGQQQRAALARIFALEPEILMLDEPFSALDSYLKWQLEQEMLDFLSGYNKTVLLVSHDRNEVYRIADRVAVISGGRLESVNDKWALFKNPETPAAAILTGCKNISRAKKTGDNSIYALDWGIELKTSQTVAEDLGHVGFRAHYFEPTDKPGLYNTVSCDITRVIEDTFSTIVIFKNSSCECPSALRWELDKAKWSALSEKKGQIYLTLPPEHLLLLK